MRRHEFCGEDGSVFNVAYSLQLSMRDNVNVIRLSRVPVPVSRMAPVTETSRVPCALSTNIN